MKSGDFDLAQCNRHLDIVIKSRLHLRLGLS